MRRVGVTGGRSYRLWTVVINVMRRLQAEDPDTVIVHGGAPGADETCEFTAMQFDLATERHEAAWDKHGRAAGPIRNQAMVDSGLDLLIVFPGGRGTADMVRRARAAGVPVEEVSE